MAHHRLLKSPPARIMYIYIYIYRRVITICWMCSQHAGQSPRLHRSWLNTQHTRSSLSLTHCHSPQSHTIIKQGKDLQKGLSIHMRLPLNYWLFYMWFPHGMNCHTCTGGYYDGDDDCHHDFKRIASHIPVFLFNTHDSATHEQTAN